MGRDKGRRTLLQPHLLLLLLVLLLLVVAVVVCRLV